MSNFETSIKVTLKELETLCSHLHQDIWKINCCALSGMCVFVWELYFLQLQINVRCWLPCNGTMAWVQSSCGLILHQQLEESPPSLMSPGLMLPQRAISWSRKDYSQVHCLKQEWERRGSWEETPLLSVFSLWVAWWCHRHAWNLRALGPFVFHCRGLPQGHFSVNRNGSWEACSLMCKVEWSS